MIWTIAIIFFLLWLLGVVTSITLGGFIHLLMGVAAVMIVVGILKVRKSRRAQHPQQSS